jgi:hypothetical protein
MINTRVWLAAHDDPADGGRGACHAFTRSVLASSLVDRPGRDPRAGVDRSVQVDFGGIEVAVLNEEATGSIAGRRAFISYSHVDRKFGVQATICSLPDRITESK